mgnify:CR=1 FL=1
MAKWSHIFAGTFTNTPSLASRSFSKVPSPEIDCRVFNHQLLHQTCPSMSSISLQGGPPSSLCLHKHWQLSQVFAARFQKSPWLFPCSSAHPQSKTKGSEQYMDQEIIQLQLSRSGLRYTKCTLGLESMQ